jgi:hypothetical protein
LGPPDKDGGKGKRPTSLGQLLGKSKWEKPLADWITATGVGFVGQEMRNKEAERVERNDGAISLRMMFERSFPGLSKLKFFNWLHFCF